MEVTSHEMLQTSTMTLRPIYFLAVWTKGTVVVSLTELLKLSSEIKYTVQYLGVPLVETSVRSFGITERSNLWAEFVKLCCWGGRR
jgi:hypothetical protein